jgi:hypothetical protein
MLAAAPPTYPRIQIIEMIPELGELYTTMEGLGNDYPSEIIH